LVWASERSNGFEFNESSLGSLSQIMRRPATTCEVIAVLQNALHGMEAMVNAERQRAVRTTRFGERLSEWRARRRESQLSLALDANVSQRHLSYIESGRAHPSREMVVRLCEALDIPLRARNELLTCAGYATLYRETSLESSEMRSVRETLRRIVEHHEPYPAFVVDREWRVVMSNEAATRIVSACIGELTVQALSPDGALNFMRMMFEPTEMRPRILNWTFVAPRLLARLSREAGGDPQSPSSALLRELAPTADCGQRQNEDFETLEPSVPLEISIDGSTLRLFNAITTFGTPQDVALQELRIEMSFPAALETDLALRRYASAAPKDAAAFSPAS
jgi:transcriptional regulator with XRE-family HTH domain